MTPEAGQKHAFIQETVIRNELGLHARAAASVAGIAAKATGEIWLERNGNRVDAKSVIDILTLACPKGSRVRLIAENEEDSGIIEAISSAIAKGFGENT